MPPPSRSANERPGRLSAQASLVLAGTLVAVAWGAFAFGAVYRWAYVPLAIVCACVGLFGLATGRRPIGDARWVLLPIVGIGMVGAIQLLPLPGSWLVLVSPGTVAFLRRYDLAYAFALDPNTNTPVAVAHAISVTPLLTLRALALLAAPLLLFVGLYRTLSRTAARRLAGGVVAIGCALALVGVGQKALLGDHAYGGMRIYGFWRPQSLLTSPFGPFINRNHFAGWMLMATPLALGLAAGGFVRALPTLRGKGARAWLVWCSDPDGGLTLMYFVAAMLMTLSLFMTGSRSGIGCFVIVAGGMLLAARRLGSARTMIGLTIVATLTLGLVLQWAGPDAALERFVRASQSTSLRLDIWRASLAVFRQFPVLGSGLDSFGTVMLVFQAGIRDLRYVEAHNDYLQLLVEGGLITFGLTILAIAAVVRGARLRFRANDDGLDGHWVRVGAAIGLVAIGLQSFVEFSLQMPGNAALFTVLLAMVLYVPTPIRK